MAEAARPNRARQKKYKNQPQSHPTLTPEEVNQVGDLWSHPGRKALEKLMGAAVTNAEKVVLNTPANRPTDLVEVKAALEGARKAMADLKVAIDRCRTMSTK